MLKWQTHAMRLALAAMETSEDRFQKVGACALAHDHTVLGVSYNGLAAGIDAPEGFWDDRDKRRPYMIHAETNLLSLFSRGEGGLLACTLLPCNPCALNIAAHGIKEVVFGDVYDKDQRAIDTFKFYGIKLTQLKL